MHTFGYRQDFSLKLLSNIPWGYSNLPLADFYIFENFPDYAFFNDLTGMGWFWKM